MANYFHILKLSIHFKDLNQGTIVDFAEKLELIGNESHESDSSGLIESLNSFKSFNIDNFNAR